MKNIIISILLIIILALTGCTIFKDDSPYPKGGRDTVAEFGDRRFVILIGYKSNENSNLIKDFDLYDRKINESIDYNIYNYKTNKTYVYTVGYNGYTKLNYNTGEYKQSHDLSIFNQEDQDIFIKIENGDSLN